MSDEIKILVVDDEQVVLDSINKHLRGENYIVHNCLTVNEALSILESTDIDIVITDFMMPNIDGLELIKIIKSQNPDIPIIMITGYATIDAENQSAQYGAFGYISKPFSKAELLEVIHRAVRAAFPKKLDE